MVKKDNGRIVYPFEPESHHKTILITKGRVIDPVNNRDEVMNVACKDGTVVSVSKAGPKGFSADCTIDARGLWVVPGLVDLHVHLREPGREDKETIETGSQAAAAGGFTALVCMPNTSPALDDASKISYVVKHAERCPCRVYPAGTITKDLAGDTLSPFEEMIKAGARAVSDDGKSVYKSNIMRSAFERSKMLGIPILCHCEDSDLSGCGLMNEGAVSAKLGLRGIPSVSEDIIVARDILLAEYTGAKLHVCHVSTAGSVELIRRAKKRGVRVTAETCPHYIAFTEEACSTLDTNKKMNPPLKTTKDRKAVIRGLADGTIDVIASDHAPHRKQEKDASFQDAPFGVIGLETMVGAAITYLIDTGILSPAELIIKMSVNPNRVLGLKRGNLSAGSCADITLIDPKTKWKVDSTCFFSKSRNCVFEGMELSGLARYTIREGTIVYKKE